ncbi:MAG: hypothetical protein L6Q71_04710 [Planctomycetes bacterium]|nr:hypothetical protein [Planctomycetota bacterium]NUQ35213.1 hypothetical protein [Planctomycetaceae bacterium]
MVKTVLAFGCIGLALSSCQMTPPESETREQMAGALEIEATQEGMVEQTLKALPFVKEVSLTVAYKPGSSQSPDDAIAVTAYVTHRNEDENLGHEQARSIAEAVANAFSGVTVADVVAIDNCGVRYTFRKTEDELPNALLSVISGQRRMMVENVEELLAPYEPKVVAWVSLSTVWKKSNESLHLSEARPVYTESREERVTETKNAVPSESVQGEIGGSGTDADSNDETIITKTLSEGLEQLEYDTKTVNTEESHVILDQNASSIAISIPARNESKLPKGGVDDLRQLVANATGLPLERVSIVVIPAR